MMVWSRFLGNFCQITDPGPCIWLECFHLTVDMVKKDTGMNRLKNIDAIPSLWVR